MSRKVEDTIEAEVRRRYADLLSSAGVDSGRLSLEVLYLLPEEFVREYTELFWETFREDLPGSNMGAGKDQGQVKKKAGEINRNRMKKAEAGSARPAQGGGKRFRSHWLIRNEEALEVKRRVDRKLVRLIQSTRTAVRTDRMGDEGSRGNREPRDDRGRFKRETGY